MISVQNLSVEFNCTPLFDSANFVINKKDKIALVGKNGAGKSTMLKIIAGLQSPSSGTVAVPADTVIGYLPQQMVLADSTTVRDEVKKAFDNITRLKAEIDAVNNEIASRTDYESESYAKLIEHVTTLNEHLVMMGSENCDAEMEKTLVGLGFNRSDFDRPTSEFSGGWRQRLHPAPLPLSPPPRLPHPRPTPHPPPPTPPTTKPRRSTENRKNHPHHHADNFKEVNTHSPTGESNCNSLLHPPTAGPQERVFCTSQPTLSTA